MPLANAPHEALIANPKSQSRNVCLEIWSRARDLRSVLRTPRKPAGILQNE